MKKHSILWVFLLSGFLAGSLTACGSADDEDKTSPAASAEVLYNDAYGKFMEGKYKESVPLFEEVERCCCSG